jgi:hypothetical protein
MAATEKKSKSSTRSTKQKFTRGHEILLTGLIGSGMSYPNIFKLEMAIKTEERALELAIWIYEQAKAHNGEFPTPMEIMRQANVKPW